MAGYDWLKKSSSQEKSTYSPSYTQGSLVGPSYPEDRDPWSLLVRGMLGGWVTAVIVAVAGGLHITDAAHCSVKAAVSVLACTSVLLPMVRNYFIAPVLFL